MQSDTVYAGGKQSLAKPSFYENRLFPSAPHTYCGTGRLPDDFVSSQTDVLMRFRSGAMGERGTGFTVTATVLQPCHRNYTALAGRLISSQSATCDTHISVPHNYTVALYFMRFMFYAHDPAYKCTADTSPLQV